MVVYVYIDSTSWLRKFFDSITEWETYKKQVFWDDEKDVARAIKFPTKLFFVKNPYKLFSLVQNWHTQKRLLLTVLDFPNSFDRIFIIVITVM